MARIVVSGYMARHPVAGNVAVFLQYVVGLRRLGHQVLYLEDKGWAYSCWEPTTGRLEEFPRTGLPLVRRLVRRHAPGVDVVFVDAGAGLVDGCSWAELRERIAGCDLLLDVGGMCWLAERALARRRALVDLDPLFTQLGRFGARELDRYHVHFSYGTNIGSEDCTVPDAGVEWLPTVPPVVPDLWAAPPPSTSAPMTTVATWDSYGEVEHDGLRYGQKASEIDRLRALPEHVEVELEMALANAGPEVRESLRRDGWRVLDGGAVSATLEDYRSYIARSQAEISVAKHGYVRSRSGWVSDRTACYLAAGRPAIVQDTGIASCVPTGRGLLPFADLEQAAAAVHRVAADLERHSAAARALAREVFDYRVVLPALLARALAPARPPVTVP